MTKLAINGGPKVRTKPFPQQEVMMFEDIAAVEDVMQSGLLTGYRGNWKQFGGGPRIQELEAEFCHRFNVKHAIAINSATSGLFVALGAVLGPIQDRYYQDEPPEVIVSPYSMSCSASLPLAWDARPVFADIDETYCLDPDDVERKITDRTKAIIAVSLFGQPFDPQLCYIADKYGIPIIEDAAQAIGSTVNFDSMPCELSGDVYAGTLGSIGVFSFNQGKHVTCGEGGMVVTDCGEFATKIRLLVNHSESVVHDAAAQNADEAKSLLANCSNVYGFNLRLTEMQAALVSSQLKRFDDELEIRRRNVEYLREEIPKVCPALTPAPVREGATHSYYVFPLIWDGNRRTHTNEKESTYYTVPNLKRFIEAVCAELSTVEGREDEGVCIRQGYIDPLYTFPLFDLPEGTCPNCERLNDSTVIIYKLIGARSTLDDMRDVVAVFAKVWNAREEL